MNNNKTTTAAIVAVMAIALFSTQITLAQLSAPQKQHTQLTPQQQQLSNCDTSVVNSLPPLVPGAFPVCPGSPLMPTGTVGISAAQIQSDLAKHPPFEKLNTIKAQIQARHAAEPSATLDQILQQLTDQGLMNCPAIKNSAAPCELTPKTTAGIHPPTIG